MAVFKILLSITWKSEKKNIKFIDASHNDTEDALFAKSLILININKHFPQITIGK